MQKMRYSFWGILTTCTLSILFTGVNIFLLSDIKEKISSIYRYPYTVSNTARAMNSRTIDTNFFYRNLLLGGTSDKKEIALIIHERFLLHKADRDKIKDRYRGPEEHIERLFNATDRFHKVLLQGISHTSSYTEEEILAYLDTKVEPAYQAVKDSIKVIINFTNQRLLETEKQSSFTVNTAIIGSLLLILVILTVAFFFHKLQKKAEQAIAYREKLFALLCNNIDDVFIIYHVRDRRIEYVSAYSALETTISASCIPGFRQRIRKCLTTSPNRHRSTRRRDATFR